MNYQDSARALMALGRELSSPRQARVQKWGLENIAVLASDLGNPHLARPCVHIAGTNGKGSTAAMMESILQAAGLRTGLYTSPHLERMNERIRIHGENISDQDFAAAWGRVHTSIESLLASGALAEHPTFFECVTAMAFLAFAWHPVEVAIYEVGLGGRFDATNIVQPLVSVITPIDFDHEDFLGHSIGEIAFEKAGIIKPGAPVVASIERSEALAVVEARTKELGVSLVNVDSAWRLGPVAVDRGFYSVVAESTLHNEVLIVEPALPGRFQVRNALAAATAARVLSDRGFAISSGAIRQGISTVRWPGRLEQLSESPCVYLDGAHNPGGAKQLLGFWKENFAEARIVLVYSAMRDKAVDEIAGLLFPRADTVIFTEPCQPRAISAALLSEMVGHLAQHHIVIADPAQALEHAIQIAAPPDAVFATGSLYLVGDLRRYWGHRARARNG